MPAFCTTCASRASPKHESPLRTPPDHGVQRTVFTTISGFFLQSCVAALSSNASATLSPHRPGTPKSGSDDVNRKTKGFSSRASSRKSELESASITARGSSLLCVSAWCAAQSVIESSSSPSPFSSSRTSPASNDGGMSPSMTTPPIAGMLSAIIRSATTADSGRTRKQRTSTSNSSHTPRSAA